jgi:hypothetical protein
LQSKAKGEKARRRLGHGMRIKSQTKEVIVDVYNYFEMMKKKNPKMSGKCSVKRTSEAIGLLLIFNEYSLIIT